MEKKILLTGGAGFIGSRLCSRLQGIYDFMILDNFDEFYPVKYKLDNLGLSEKPDYGSQKGNVFNCDILDKETMDSIVSGSDIDIVIHCAALPGVRQSIKTPYTYYDVNFMGTVNMLDICRKHEISKFIMLSSSSVYGNIDVPFSETDSCSCQSVYASSKLNGENAARLYHDIYGIDSVILRLFSVYGPCQRPDLVLHKFFLNAMNSIRSSVFGSLKTARDYTYIGDIAAAMDNVIEYSNNNSGFEVFNIGSGRMISMEKLLGTVKQYFPGFEYEVTNAKEGESVKTYADISKARRVLKYNPETAFEEGVEKFYEWFREYYNE